MSNAESEEQHDDSVYTIDSKEKSEEKRRYTITKTPGRWISQVLQKLIGFISYSRIS